MYPLLCSFVMMRCTTPMSEFSMMLLALSTKITTLSCFLSTYLVRLESTSTPNISTMSKNSTTACTHCSETFLMSPWQSHITSPTVIVVFLVTISSVTKYSPAKWTTVVSVYQLSTLITLMMWKLFVVETICGIVCWREKLITKSTRMLEVNCWAWVVEFTDLK